MSKGRGYAGAYKKFNGSGEPVHDRQKISEDLIRTIIACVIGGIIVAVLLGDRTEIKNNTREMKTEIGHLVEA